MSGLDVVTWGIFDSLCLPNGNLKLMDPLTVSRVERLSFTEVWGFWLLNTCVWEWILRISAPIASYVNNPTTGSEDGQA